MLCSCAGSAASRNGNGHGTYIEPPPHEADAATLLRHLPDAIARVDHVGRCSYANAALLRTLRMHAAPIGQVLFDLPVLGATAAQWQAAVARVFATGIPDELESSVLPARLCQARFIPEAGPEGNVRTVLILVRDISDRRHALLALRESEAKYRQLIEQIPVITYALMLDDIGAAMFVSPQIRTLGYSEDEYLRDPDLWYRRMHADDRSTVTQRLRRLRQDGIPVHEDYRVYTRDGDVRWVRDQAALVRDDENRPLFIQGVLLDITDQKRAELDLRRIAHDLRERVKESRGLYAIFTALHEEGATLTDALTKVVTLLPATLQFPNDAAAAVLLNGETHQTPDYRKTNIEILVDIVIDGQRVGAVSVVYLREHAVAASGGLFLPEEIRLVHVVANSIADAVRHRETDRALSKREAYYRSLIENAADVVAILAADGVIIYGSPSFARALGYDADDLVGTSAYALVHPDDQSIAREAIDSLCPDPSGRTYEVRIRHKNGDWRYMEATGRNLLLHEAVQGIVVNARDVTESKRLEKQLVQSQKMEAVGRLAGGVAHDFNNILTAISGYADLVSADLAETDPNRADIEEIRKAANRAAALTRQLLAFSRNQFMQARVFSLSEVVSDTKRMLERLIGEDIELVTDLADGTFVRADRGHIEQVIPNLVVNARDAMPGGGRITITARNEYIRTAGPVDINPGPYVLLSVADTGTGISKEIQTQIFDPFFTTKEMGKGTGLGLSTVYGIVRQSGGRIDVTTEPGSGARFDIYLPRVSEQPAERAATAAPRPATNGSGTILVAEDEAGVRDLIRRALSRAGFTVILAGTAGEAARLFAEHGPSIDLLLSDVLMPDLTGPELAARLTAVRPDLPILYMSGYTRDALSERGEIGRTEMLIEKPFAVGTLVNRVRNILDRS